jgi:short chain dehydrogenase
VPAYLLERIFAGIAARTVTEDGVTKRPSAKGGAEMRDGGQNGRIDLGLDGRVYLVTGGSRGLGFAAAQALVADGAQVVLSAPHEGTASSAVARLAQNAATAEPAAWVIADNADRPGKAPPGAVR